MLQVHVAIGSGSSSLLQGTNKKNPSLCGGIFLLVSARLELAGGSSTTSERHTGVCRSRSDERRGGGGVFAVASLLHKTQFCLPVKDVSLCGEIFLLVSARLELAGGSSTTSERHTGVCRSRSDERRGGGDGLRRSVRKYGVIARSVLSNYCHTSHDAVCHNYCHQSS